MRRIQANAVVTYAPQPGVRECRTAGGAHREIETEEWVRLFDRHLANVGGGVASPADGGVPPCAVTEVDCDGTIFVVETCCQVGEPPEDCARRHAEKVAHACDE